MNISAGRPPNVSAAQVEEAKAERQQMFAEQAQRKSREQFDELMGQAPAAVFERDALNEGYRGRAVDEYVEAKSRDWAVETETKRRELAGQTESPEATSFQKKRGEWFEREESLREDGASPEEIAARRRAFLYGDKFDAWEFEGNGTQPQMETATTGSEAAPTVTDEASYNALKTGQKYIHNGKEYTKK